MQGQRSAVGSLPELSFHHGSAASDSSIDPQRCWNNVRNPAQDQLSDCVMSSSNASIAYLNSARQEGHNLSGWSLGETSSSAARDQVNQNDPMSVCTGAVHVMGERQYGSSDILALSNVGASQNTEQAANGLLFMQTSSSAPIPQYHNTNSEFAGPNNDDDDCQVIECVSAFRSGSSNEQLPGISSSSDPFVMPSGSGGYLVEESDGRPSSSLDGRRCKRKILEGSAGQSSGSGSSNYLQDVEGSLWHGAAAHNITASSVPAPTGNNLTINLSEQVHPRLGLSIGGAASEVPLTLSASGSAESSRRNFRLRINASHQQDCIPGTVSSTQSVGGSYNVLSAQRSLRLQPDYNSLDLGPFSAAENESILRPTVASLRRNPQSRWYRASSSGAGSSSSAISGERVAAPYEGPNSRSLPRDISEHPMFIPATNMGNSSQNPVDWSLAAGNIGTAGNLASSSRAGSSSGVNSPAPSLIPHRNSPQYSRRLSEFVRRSLLSAAGTESGSQNSSYSLVHPAPPPSSQEMALPSASGNHGHHRLHSRSAVLLERHLGSAHGIPHSARALAAASEGRSRLVSEIRNVLDLMRRGEGLRAEDVMILDQSVFFGMADLHDRHRDMRLDVDNMSYEELLALEERIGDVCTGLSEETIISRLKQRKHICIKTEGQVEAEPCCICQEEYNDGEDLGALECGHDFHSDCIKQWLLQKNLCPICKTTGLTK